MKKIFLILLSGLLLVTVLYVLGCEGNAGNRGVVGDTGDPGDPYAEPIPTNRLFAMAIGNNSITVHNGAPKLYLCFDTLHANIGDTVVCQQLTGSRVPLVDGIDGGISEWGSKYTDISLSKLVAYDNRITSARVRSAFDANYIYFLVQWTEVADSAFGLSVSPNLELKLWKHGYDSTRDINSGDYVYVGGNPKVWPVVNSNAEQDRVMFLFEITPVYWFEHDGCLVTCHASPAGAQNIPGGNFHATSSASARMDIWSWSSVTSNPTGFAEDKYLDNRSAAINSAADLGYIDGVKPDLGLAPAIPNLQSYVALPDTFYRPLYQAINDPNSDASYPLWDWQISRVAEAGWDSLATVPYYISTIPTGSRADVVAKGKYDNGTWTVELRRVRNTGNGDDAKF